jgi:hypothetical protein
MAPPTIPITVGFPRIGPKRELKMALERWVARSAGSRGETAARARVFSGRSSPPLPPLCAKKGSRRAGVAAC